MNDTPQPPSESVFTPPSAPEPPKPPVRVNTLQERAPIVGYLLVVVAVLVAVNVWASRHDKSWDLTKNHFNSLSPESVKIVKDLKQPLQLIYFGHSGDFPSAKSFLDRYGRESNRVETQYIDPDRQPDMARLYKVQTYGTIVVQSGGRNQLVSSMAEQDVTNAIVRTLKGEKKIVYFLAGEGERDPDDTGRSGYSSLKTALEAENFTVQKLVLAQSPKVPEDCAVLVIAGPEHPFVPAEVQAISQYIDGGGRAFFMINFQETGPLVDYLEKSLDVKMDPNDVVIDLSGIGRLVGAGPELPIVAKYDSHPITQDMNGDATMFPLARSVAAATSAGSRAVVSPLFETSSQSLAVTDISLLQRGGGNIDTSKALKGPFTLGVAGTIASVANSGAHAGDSTEARFTVYGSPDFAINAYLDFNGNRDLFINTMNWLSMQEAFITIRPPQPQSSPISLTQRQESMVNWTYMCAIPLFVVIMGVGVWWRRRAA